MRWSKIARRGSVFLPILICGLAGSMSPVFLPRAFGQAAQPTAGDLAGANQDTGNQDTGNQDTPGPDAADDVGRDNPGSDDGDGGNNDDPVWGYFLGKSAYIYFHELARNLLSQNGAAIADTAAKRDQLTSLLLTAEGKKHFGGTMLSDAVAGWIVSWRQAQQDDENSPGPDEEKPDTWDTENITAARMSDLLCSVYGSDPHHFRSLVDSGDIKADAAKACIADYHKLSQKWRAALSQAGLTLVVAKVDATGAEQDTGQSGSDGSAVLSFEQQPSTAPELADFSAWLHDVALFDNLTTEVNRDLSPASSIKSVSPMKIVLLQCGTTADVSGATSGNMSLCYEWLKPGYDAATAQNVEAPPE